MRNSFDMEEASSFSFHALIIGINEYKDSTMDNLEHAVSDAADVKKFLTEYLKVPEKNIRLLCDKEATRQGIINAFQGHLVRNDFIRTGDPILIYYAGHGTTYPGEDLTGAKENNPSGGIISREAEDSGVAEVDDVIENTNHGSESSSGNGDHQAICPHDREADQVKDIDDFELGTLLMELASAKGNNVTVIMDSCHSGSGTRAIRSKNRKIRARYAKPLVHTKPMPSLVPVQTHGASAGTRHIAPDTSYNHPNLSSHVLLAACRQDESAYEIADEPTPESRLSQGGYFTQHLLKLLKDNTLPRISYFTLLSKVPLFEGTVESEPTQEPSEEEKAATTITYKQTPQCEGKHKNRRVFNGKALGSDKRLVPLKREDQRMIVEAGEVHGVVVGTRFVVQKGTTYAPQSEIVGSVIAQEVSAVWCYVTPIDDSSLDHAFESAGTILYARVSFWANAPFKLAFAHQPGLTSTERQQVLQDKLAKPILDYRENADVHIVCTTPRNAKAVVTVTDTEIILYRKDGFGKLCPKELHRPLIGDAADSDQENINLAARFDFHLHRENAEHPYRDLIHMDLERLERKNSKKKTGFIMEGRAVIKHDEDAEYALVLRNYSYKDLWCSAYYFDPSNYSVIELYKPPSPSGLSPLNSGAKLSVGSVSSGYPPFSFFLQDGEDYDTGFIKVFFSESYADLSMLEQGEEFAYKDPKAATSSRDGKARSVDRGLWDSLTAITHVYRNRPCLPKDAYS